MTKIIQLVIVKRPKRYAIIAFSKKGVEYELDYSREEVEREIGNQVRKLKAVTEEDRRG